MGARAVHCDGPSALAAADEARRVELHAVRLHLGPQTKQHRTLAKGPDANSAIRGARSEHVLAAAGIARVRMHHLVTVACERHRVTWHKQSTTRAQ